MRLTVQRGVDSASTPGELLIDGAHECWTLEDPVGGGPLGKGPIPAGTYEVVIDMSTRFGRLMPHLLNVPGFAGIRIHSGNTSADTAGCILLGQQRGPNEVLASRAAFAAFYPKLETALAEGKVFIDVANPIT